MLKASAPQNSTRRGSCCFAAVLDSLTPSHLLFDLTSKGLRWRHIMGDIGCVVDRRSEVEQICCTLIGQFRKSEWP
jgi:hypothetical protein